MSAARFTFVDGLRGVAAMSVVLFHGVEGHHIDALYAVMPTAQSILEHGNCGVAIFFVLSGFVISHSLIGRELTPASAGRFMLRRSIRLDPPYWFAIALTCTIATVKDGSTFSVPQIVAHVFYAQDLLGFKSISSIFWTLCLEIQFYIVFALLLLTRSRHALVVAFVISIPLSLSVVFPGLFTSLWYGFLLGVGAYAGSTWFLAYAVVLCGIGLYQHDVFMMVCVTTAVSLFVAARFGKLTTLLNWWWLQFLGTISYSLYLTHNPVTAATFRMGWKLTERTAATEALWWSISILACIAVATLTYLAIERPSMWLSKTIAGWSKRAAGALSPQ